MEDAAEDRPQAVADPARQRRDRGAGEQHPAATSIKRVKIRAPTEPNRYSSAVSIPYPTLPPSQPKKRTKQQVDPGATRNRPMKSRWRCSNPSKSEIPPRDLAVFLGLAFAFALPLASWQGRASVERTRCLGFDADHASPVRPCVRVANRPLNSH